MIENPSASLFDYLGGEEPFRRLVAAFYEGVATDPILRPLYPEDLEGARERLTLFLIQFFGGPTTYSEQRGHPRLRARHLQFPIGPAARDAWLRHMGRALEVAEIPTPAREVMWAYFVRTAHFLMNRRDDP